MQWTRIVPVLALSLALSGGTLAQAQNPCTANQDATHQTKKQLKAEEKANKAQAKADKKQRKALDTSEQKDADKAQDKANKERRNANTPQP